MSRQVLRTVNLGSGNAGLATVGYTLYDKDRNEIQARTTSGVGELGTSTGIYSAIVNMPDDDAIVVWDTGGASPRYATEDYQSQVSRIAEETDHIRLIWNSLRNQGDIFSKLSEKISALKPGKSKEYDKELSDIKKLVQAISEREFLTIGDVTKALNIKVAAPTLPPIPAPIVNIPKTVIPDYTKQLQQLSILLSGITQEISRIPKQQKDYTSDLSKLAGKFETLVLKLDTKLSTTAKTAELKDLVASLLKTIETFKQEIGQSIVDNTKLDKYIKDGYIIQEVLKMAQENQTRESNHRGIKLALGIK